MLLRGWVRPVERELIADIGAIVAQAPFRHMVTPGGHAMSVAMTNCGNAGWVTDRSGYRYDTNDPLAGKPWPAMPPSFRALAGQTAAEAGFANFSPDACLINRYQPGARMSLHQDRDEHDFRRADRLGLTGAAGDFPVRWVSAQRQAAPLPAGAWRHRGMGRSGAAGLSRRGAAGGRRACGDGAAADQSDVSENAVICFPLGDCRRFVDVCFSAHYGLTADINPRPFCAKAEVGSVGRCGCWDLINGHHSAFVHFILASRHIATSGGAPTGAMLFRATNPPRS